MVVLGVGVYKDTLKEIAEKGNMRVEDTPASNVIRVHRVPGKVPMLFDTARKEGYIAEWGQLGQVVVRRK